MLINCMFVINTNLLHTLSISINTNVQPISLSQSLGEPIDWTLDPAVGAAMTAFREGTVWPHILHEVTNFYYPIYFSI